MDSGGRKRCSQADNRLSSLGETMLKEHDRIVLTCDIPGEGLEAGDVGTIVHVHRHGEGPGRFGATLPRRPPPDMLRLRV